MVIHASPTSPLDGGSFVSLAIRVWSGAAVIHRETDLALVAGQLPPKTLVGDGDKKLIDPKSLNPLDALRKRADAAVRKVGFRFLNGHFVPDALLPELKTELDAIEREFMQQAVPHLVSELPKLYAEWEAKHPNWASMLRGAQISPMEVGSRCTFNAVFYKAAPADPNNPQSAINQGLASAAAGIDAALYADVADQASQVLKETFVGRQSPPSQRSLRPVRALAQKLTSFAFLDPGIGKLAAILESGLASVPTQGYLDAMATSRIVESLNRLTSVNAIAQALAAPIVPVQANGQLPIPAPAIAPPPAPANASPTTASPPPTVVERVTEDASADEFAVLV